MNKNKNALGNNRYFDAKMALIGAMIMGLAVYSINYKYSFELATIAASKQMAYTFFVGGFTTRICENLATHYTSDKVSITMAVMVTSALAIGMTYIVHSFKGTPNAFESTIPTIIGAPASFIYWSLRKRKQLNTLPQQ